MVLRAYSTGTVAWLQVGLKDEVFFSWNCAWHCLVLLFFIEHIHSLNVQVMLSALHLRKLRQHFLPSLANIAGKVFRQWLRQVKGKRQVFFLFASCFFFNDLLQPIVPICIGLQVLLSLKYQAIH